MKKLLFPLMAAILFVGCQANYNVPKPKSVDIWGLATPVKLKPEITTVWLTDYFTDTRAIDSVEHVKGMAFSFPPGHFTRMFVQVTDRNLPWLNVFHVWAHGIRYDIPVFKSPKIYYCFVFDPHGKHYKSVYLFGEMNSWNRQSLPMRYYPDDGTWKVWFYAKPGKYQYLLKVDGKEIQDPNNPNKVPNGFGGFNSVMQIGNPKPQLKPYLYTDEYDDNSVYVAYKNDIEQLLVFYNNFQLPHKAVQWYGHKIRIILPANASADSVAYLRVYAANKYGLSNDLLIPLRYGRPVTNAKVLTRRDFHRMVIYNLLVDRFFDGQKSNDMPVKDSVLPKANYMGGDLLGIIDKLSAGYFDSLGVNTLWISPIVKNVSGAWGLWKKPLTKFSAYHGYWPVSFTQIDPHFGNAQQLKRLVALLHAKDMNLLLDFVAHHVHKRDWIWKKHPDWFTSMYLPNGKPNIGLWDAHRLTTWFDTFLPTLDNSKPQVYNMVTDSAVWWVKTYNIDGFRYDAAKHIPIVFWRTLTRKLKLQVEIPRHKPVYQIGETYGSPELISQYLGSGLLDAQFDFNVYDALKSTVAGNGSFKHLKDVLSTSFDFYGWHNLMGYILDNQDQGRFISFASGDLPMDVSMDSLKAIGWQKNISVSDTLGYYRQALAFAFITTIPGVPVVYYGDEIGLPGAGDPDNRRMMEFSGLNKYQLWLKKQFSSLIKFRTGSMPLLYGDFHWLYVSKNQMVYMRNYFDKTVIVALNKSTKPVRISFTLDSHFAAKAYHVKNTDFQILGKQMTLWLKPVSYAFIFN